MSRSAHGQLLPKGADGRGLCVKDTKMGEGEQRCELVLGTQRHKDSGEAEGTSMLVLMSRIA
jgi:hypothetical protein